MTLDTVTTVAIGRNGPDGPMNEHHWNLFQSSVRIACERFGTVVACTTGQAVGSDDDREGQPEETAIVVVINVTDEATLRSRIAYFLRTFDQTSACFATDRAHEPVFNTETGARPVSA